jgi:hypothetical protein
MERIASDRAIIVMAPDGPGTEVQIPVLRTWLDDSPLATIHLALVIPSDRPETEARRIKALLPENEVIWDGKEL